MISVNELTKEYGPVLALNNVSFNVKEGEVFGILGPNGSGKTTMIKILTGQIKPTSGHARVLDYDVKKSSITIRKHVGIIPEQETPPSFLTAEEYLYFIAKVRKIKDIEFKIGWWMDYLEFRNQKDLLCKDLSRGTRQKLMIAQAFLHEPKLAFIDEPLINLDPIMQDKVKKFIKSEAKKGNTIFVSTHVLDIAEDICDSLAIINHGNLLYAGKVKKNLEKFFIKSVKGSK
ncbi:ABC transporter ATP-binding protein [Candidatus Woesearchaeota archaeon]|nr:ABC transporter ATP-binding protein [Candidatus Woesearchaeota archaeon]